MAFKKRLRSRLALYALAHGAVELLGSASTSAKASAGFFGITDAARALASTPRAPSNLAALLGGGGTGGRI